MRKLAICLALAGSLLGLHTPARAHHSWEETHASWFRGSRGACGRLTGYYAAHRYLPCGTKVQVSHRGRTITVVVRDRGPNVRGRELDLSKDAFSRLRSPRTGVITVKYKRAS